MSTAQHSRIAVTATFVTNLVACVHISGDVAEGDLARVMTHLYMRRCRIVYIDLAAVTFAGTTLLTFIASVYAGDRGRYGEWVAEVDEIGDERPTITTGARPIAPGHAVPRQRRQPMPTRWSAGRTPSSSRRWRTRRSISSRIGRTCSTSWPAGSSRSQLR
jgi:hypothetical protein